MIVTVHNLENCPLEWKNIDYFLERELYKHDFEIGGIAILQGYVKMYRFKLTAINEFTYIDCHDIPSWWKELD